MRIISGDYKGQKIIFPKNLPVRPTTDIAKESIFNILSNKYDFNNISILDLFAGSGNISYEFYSRGSKDVLAVDNNLKCVNFVKKESKRLGMNISVIKTDVFKFFKNKVKVDVIFADPPYSIDTKKLNLIIKLVFNNQVLNENGTFILEHYKKIDFTEHKNFKETRTYGDSSFSFFEQ